MLAKIFPRNESTLDRTLRVIGGAAVLSLAFIGPQTAWGYLGIIPLATGALGSCPLYTLFGIGTCKVKNNA